jgi:AcrR family transcriptional regulator
VELPHVDPRIVRTRTALREALASLLRDRNFEELSLNEIAEASGLNRATIYKHYADKFALLDAWIADDFRERLVAATAGSERTGAAKVAAVIAATCECLRWVGTLGRPDDRLFRPIAEARIRAFVSRAVDYGLAQKIMLPVAKPELAAAMASSAIFGAAAMWAAAPSSRRVLEVHVAKVIAALATLVVPNPQLPARIAPPLAFE